MNAEWMNEWMNKWMNEWINGWMQNKWIKECRINKWMQKWMNGEMNEWSNEERTNECIIQGCTFIFEYVFLPAPWSRDYYFVMPSRCRFIRHRVFSINLIIHVC